uniref:Uncharacterized protein n=1 Tax=Strombidium rassoulzadegani TaxID=1082188 RepID=A0A7S3FXS3_9SPIT|mmetsp:Transcript_17908/g.30457  ORF Transcript_17908/g.30457 Transcript_17908/m.30457 type:complete len:139 (+) Transcript_17908:1053-1469(+)
MLKDEIKQFFSVRDVMGFKEKFTVKPLLSYEEIMERGLPLSPDLVDQYRENADELEALVPKMIKDEVLDAKLRAKLEHFYGIMMKLKVLAEEQKASLNLETGLFEMETTKFRLCSKDQLELIGLYAAYFRYSQFYNWN